MAVFNGGNVLSELYFCFLCWRKILTIQSLFVSYWKDQSWIFKKLCLVKWSSVTSLSVCGMKAFSPWFLCSSLWVSVLQVKIWYFQFLTFNKCVTLNRKVNFKYINLWNSAPCRNDLRIQQDVEEQGAHEHKHPVCYEEALKRGRHHLFFEIRGDMSE